LFREQSYDRDAEDGAITMRNFEDGDEELEHDVEEEEDDSLDDVVDEDMPGMKRSLGEELASPVEEEEL
jgi:hypothetical protein